MSVSASDLPPLAPAPSVPADWKDEVSARLRAHRTRRGRVPENQPALPGMETLPASSVAARVAERYARVPSWREAMAAEAAVKAAQEAAARAALEAKKQAHERAQQEATLDAQERLCSDAAHSQDRLPIPGGETHPAVELSPEPEPKSQPWQPDLIRYSVSSDSLPAPRSTPAQACVRSSSLLPPADFYGMADPLEEALIEPARPLPARVIEFPRELVAPRKARPRLAEGPLREDNPEGNARRSAAAAEPVECGAAELSLFEADDNPGRSENALSGAEDLRILEAEPDSMPNSNRLSRPDWLSINLDAERPLQEPKPSIRSSVPHDQPLHVAPMADRMMAGVVDVALTFAAFLLFLMVFAACTTHLPSGRLAFAGAAITLLAMWILYQFVFFSMTNGTPGMRYAKIALCTFDDENPTRSAMRGRISAQLLSALPFGLGFLWAYFDEDALGWHDRMTQTYQRSYREL